jgi:outer membrane biosynthesis protein TonB
MGAIGLRQPWSSSENKPLLWALVVSVAVHAIAFWLLFVLAIFSALLSIGKREAITQLLHTQAARARTAPEQEPQLVFVQVDPSQAAAEAPKNAKYYSAHNSVAANPDPQGDTGTPRIEGKQTVVPKTEDTPRPTPATLQPSPPKDTSKPSKDDQKSKPEERPKPGDLAMLKPNDTPAKDASETPQVEHERPHTLAEAHMLAGDKMKQDGGVKRREPRPAFDVAGSPFGEYDDRIVTAIQQRWYDLLENETFAQNRVGTVVVTFRLYPDGHITDVRIAQSDVGEVLGYVCMSAIQDPSPYDHWPEAMLRKNKIDTGHDYRDCRMVFAYE